MGASLTIVPHQYRQRHFREAKQRCSEVLLLDPNNVQANMQVRGGANF